jgi:hypothetical protein
MSARPKLLTGPLPEGFTKVYVDDWGVGDMLVIETDCGHTIGIDLLHLGGTHKGQICLYKRDVDGELDLEAGVSVCFDKDALTEVSGGVQS